MENNIEFLNKWYKDNGGFNINRFQVRLSRDGGQWINCFDLGLTEDDVNNLYHRSDFRKIPMKPFEIGDYVCTTNKRTIMQITKSNMYYFDGTNHMAQNTHMVHWEPSIGDIVLIEKQLGVFYDESGYTLKKYTVLLKVVEIKESNEYSRTEVLLSYNSLVSLWELIPYINGVK